MADNEIKIVEHELTDCEGNLKSIHSEWNAVPRLPEDEIVFSSGRSADHIREIIEAGGMVRRSFETLLGDTVSFLEALGVSFETADDEAARQIDSITTIT